MPTSSSLVALEVVMTTYVATSDNKVGIMTALGFQCMTSFCSPHYDDITWVAWHLMMIRLLEIWLFVQQLFSANSKANIEAQHYWPFVRKICQLLGELISKWWILLTKSQKCWQHSVPLWHHGATTHQPLDQDQSFVVWCLLDVKPLSKLELICGMSDLISNSFKIFFFTRKCCAILWAELLPQGYFWVWAQPMRGGVTT